MLDMLLISKEVENRSEFNPPYDNQYNKAHAYTLFSRLLHIIGNFTGIILHGDQTPERLEKKLKAGSIVRLIKENVPLDTKILSIAAQQLIVQAYNGLKDGVMDVHFHVLGKDEGNYVPPQKTWKDWAIDRFIHFFAGITDVTGSTEKARKWLHLHAGHFYGLNGVVLPIHPFINKDGRVNWSKSHSYLTNASADKTAETFKNDHANLYAAVSIHPNDPLWESKLIEAKNAGKNLVKWFPSQGIMPNDPSVFPFYAKMAELKMTLICHTGPEHAVDTATGFENAGNPLHLREALKRGVNVIFAHSGQFDLIPDLDHPEQEPILGFKLFKRVAEESKMYPERGKAFGDLSGILRTGDPDVFKELITASKVVNFIYGSDFPYPLANAKDVYDKLMMAQLIPVTMVAPLKEIKELNPLLANFILARTVKHEGESFPLSCFSAKEHLHLIKT